VRAPDAVVWSRVQGGVNACGVRKACGARKNCGAGIACGDWSASGALEKSDER